MTFLFYLLFFSFIAVVPAYCYIDPGTGSMLFSVLIGFVSIFFFAAKTAWIKIKTLPIWYKKDGENISSQAKDIVIYSEGKQYWNVFRPVLEEFDRRKIPVTFYTSDENDLCFDFQSEFVTKSFIGKGNKAYATLNLLEANIVLMTTPGLDVYQLKRSKMVKHYSHILHSADDVTTYRLFGLDYFDSVLLTGDYQKKAIRQLEKLRNLLAKKLITVGCTYLDIAMSKIKELPAIEKKDSLPTVLVSPSWGENGLLKKYGMSLLKPLAESGFHIIIRPHPQTSISEKDMLSKLQEELKSYEEIEWDFERENIMSMHKADIMISDFSGIIFDYMFLFSRPVIYTSYNFDKRPYDCSDLEEEPFKFRCIRELGIKLTEKDFLGIKDIILQNVNNSNLKEKIIQAKNTAWANQGQAGIKCVDALLEIKKELINNQ